MVYQVLHLLPEVGYPLWPDPMGGGIPEVGYPPARFDGVYPRWGTPPRRRTPPVSWLDLAGVPPAGVD